MKVAIVSNFPVYTGTGKVAYALWQGLQRQSLAKADYFLTHRMNKGDHVLPEYQVKGLRVIQPFDYMANPVLSRLMLYFIDPHLLPKGYDVYHFANHMIARFATIRRPSVVTVHDVLQFKYPEVFASSLTSRIYNYFMEKSIKSLPQANHLICVSNWSKMELLKIIKNIDSQKVSVVYNGLDHSVFYPRDKMEARRKLGWDPSKKYILNLGSDIPRKQIPLLIKSFKTIKRLFPEAVLVRHGEKKGITPRLIEELGLENEIIYHGYTPENDLPYFYSAADIIIQPSSEEGFCFPVIEAMACGIPVVSGNFTSLGEVCGGAQAAEIEVLDEDHLVSAINKVLRMDASELEMAKVKGIENAKRFSWERNAMQTLAVYEKVTESNKRKAV